MSTYVHVLQTSSDEHIDHDDVNLRIYSMSEVYCIMIADVNSACYSNFSRLDIVLSQEAVNIRNNYVKANIQQ